MSVKEPGWSYPLGEVPPEPQEISDGRVRCGICRERLEYETQGYDEIYYVKPCKNCCKTTKGA